MMRRYMISMVMILFSPVCIFAQTGAPPFASFSQNQFAAINNGNLNTIFTIPIMSSPGRGSSLNISAVYNSQVWTPVINGGWLLTGGWVFNFPMGYVSYAVNTTDGSCGRLGSGYTETTTFSSYVYTDPMGTAHPFVNDPEVVET